MAAKEKKTIHHYMRALHRDLGFFAIGIIIIYALSGITLVYRDTDFLKHDTLVKSKLAPNMEPSELGRMLHQRDFQVTKVDGDTVFFQNGTYNSTTGIAVFTGKEIIFPLNKFINLHKAASQNPLHWINIIFGILLLFLAISSFWMFNLKTKLFRRGLYLAGVGIVTAILLLII